MTDNWQPQHDPRQPPATQWQPGPYPPYQPPQYGPPPPPRKSRKGWAAIGCLGLVGLVVVIAAIGAAHKSSSSTSVAPLQTIATVAPPAHSAAAVKAPASSAAPAAAKPTLVTTFSGSGQQKTAQFTVGTNWGISYAFDCTSFGGTGNFVVFTDGGSDFNGVSVNDLAASKSAVTYAYGDPGTHYLEINSECSWTVKVYDEG